MGTSRSRSPGWAIVTTGATGPQGSFGPNRPGLGELPRRDDLRRRTGLDDLDPAARRARSPILPGSAFAARPEIEPRPAGLPPQVDGPPVAAAAAVDAAAPFHRHPFEPDRAGQPAIGHHHHFPLCHG